jgi:hypothetical protein
MSGPVRVGSSDVALILEPIGGLRRLTWSVVSGAGGVMGGCWLSRKKPKS